jgi:hypothetical protein
VMCRCRVSSKLYIRAFAPGKDPQYDYEFNRVSLDWPRLITPARQPPCYHWLSRHAAVFCAYCRREVAGFRARAALKEECAVCGGVRSSVRLPDKLDPQILLRGIQGVRDDQLAVHETPLMRSRGVTMAKLMRMSNATSEMYLAPSLPDQYGAFRVLPEDVTFGLGPPLRSAAFSPQ